MIKKKDKDMKAIEILPILSTSRSNSNPIPSPSKRLPSLAPELIVSKSQNVQLSRNPPSKKQMERKKQLSLSLKSKERINLVIIGHVDAGKSTLMGHLLFLKGVVNKKMIHKYEKQSKEMGKSSFHFAWVFDEHEEERNRGVTVDIGVKRFSTKRRCVTLLDAPGHRDFIPNMISGAAQADAAILVVPASSGEFESAFEENGQTREHTILARSLGINQIIIAVNKMDTVNWSMDRFKEIVSSLKSFFKQAGFKEKNVWPIPVSGLTGENIIDQKESQLKWYSGPCLIDLIDNFELPVREINKPLRFLISDVYSCRSLGFTVAGRVETGTLMERDKLLIMPSKEIVCVKSIEENGIPITLAKAGDNVEIGLRDISQACMKELTSGSMLCDIYSPVPLITRFQAKILTMNIKIPLLRGDQVIVYTHTDNLPANISKLYATLDGKGNVLKKKPRFIPRKSQAIIEVRTQRSICVEIFSEYKELGRCSFRRRSETIAVGIIQAIYSN